MTLGHEALRDCESQLRDLLRQASDARDYDTVQRLADWARALVTLATNDVLAPRASQPGNVHEQSRAQLKKQRRRSQRKRRAGNKKYPRFIRLGDELIKIGWSKKQKREYQHKALRRVINLLTERLCEVGGPSELVTTEKLFPLCDSAEKTEIPGYQAYLCLAWLRDSALIEQVGRQGYYVTSPDKLRNAIDDCWKTLRG